jgi:hypothetical protein
MIVLVVVALVGRTTVLVPLLADVVGWAQVMALVGIGAAMFSLSCLISGTSEASLAPRSMRSGTTSSPLIRTALGASIAAALTAINNEAEIITATRVMAALP